MGVSATYRLYRTQDDDWICVAAVTDDEFRALCTVLGVAEIVDDARFATAASRAEHRRQLETILEPRFRTKTATLLDAHARRRRRPERGPGRHAGRRGTAVRLRQRRARPRRALRASAPRRHAPVRRAHRLLRDARPRRRTAAARRPGHPRDAPRARPPRPRDRRARSPTASATSPTTTTPNASSN